jgi:hypothetical protein
VSESAISRPRRKLSKTALAAGSITCLLGLFLIVGCEKRKKQDNGDSSATASDRTTSATNPTYPRVSSPVQPPEQGRVQSLTELRQNYLNALEQAKRNNLAAIEQSNENYSRAIEQYQQEYWASVDTYRSMTPAEKALIHSRSLAQIGQDHDMELRQAREEYSAAVEKAEQDYQRLAGSARIANIAPTTSKENGEAESIPGSHGLFMRYPYGYMVGELCSETTVNDCYPRDWQPWLKELERRTVAEQIDTLEADTGIQGKGHLVISWNTEKRILFGAWPPNSGDEICVYFIVAPKARELDIVWKNKDGVRYLGPNASMLKTADAYEWLKKLPW